MDLGITGHVKHWFLFVSSFSCVFSKAGFYYTDYHNTSEHCVFILCMYNMFRSLFGHHQAKITGTYEKKYTDVEA